MSWPLDHCEREVVYYCIEREAGGVVVLNEITKTAVVSNGVRERNTASNSELKKKLENILFLQNVKK